MDREDAERCCFDDLVDHWSSSARKRPTAAKVTRSMLEALRAAGLRDRSVLDLGCGIGDLAVAAAGSGASSARGYDLSAKAIDEAGRLARERGVADRTTFEVGDAAKVDLPPADVVVLNRVFCCYRDVGGLLERSLAVAGAVYGFTIPRATGLAGVWNRVRAAIGNRWFRLRKKQYAGFQAFVHDVDRIDARVRTAGFSPFRRETRRLVWDLAVYVR